MAAKSMEGSVLRHLRASNSMKTSTLYHYMMMMMMMMMMMGVCVFVLLMEVIQ